MNNRMSDSGYVYVGAGGWLVLTGVCDISFKSYTKHRDDVCMGLPSGSERKHVSL